MDPTPWAWSAGPGWAALPAAAWAVPAAAAGLALGWSLGRLRRVGAAPRVPPVPPADDLAAEASADDQRRLDRRLAEIHRMTGGLAHEIKNPLSTIGLNVQLLREDVGEVRRRVDATPAGDDEAAEGLGRVERRLEGVHRETARLRDILDDFLRFAGRIRLDLAPIDLDAVVEELADFFTPEAASRGIRLRTDPGLGAGAVHADAGLVKQAVLNLLMNAVQAMAPDSAKRGDPGAVRGELVVRTRPDPERAERVLVEVTDTGPGITPDRLERVFEPYHTGRRGGSGLGLPTSRRIVELHGGTLDLHSEVGRGTVFKLSLPRSGPRPQAAVDGSPAEA